jgi:sensor histidine kinase regulating citrate/malate metabolism
MLWIKWRARIVAAFAILVGVLAAYLKVKRTGKLEERAKSEARSIKAENQDLKEALNALEKKADIARAIDAMPPGDASKRLRDEWSRD